MTTKFRRCLYVGIGGAGIKMLLELKKYFIDRFGSVPPMVGFMGFDTDRFEFDRSIKSSDGRDITLAKDEMMSLCVDFAEAMYYLRPESFSWVPKGNIKAMNYISNVGSGCVRSNGRVAFSVNRKGIAAAVNAKLASILNAMSEGDFELLNFDVPEVHMVFSLAGGTGSGMYIDMAYLMQDFVPAAKVTGYAISPAIFENLLLVGDRQKYNAYASLVELDYFMHRSIGSDSIVLNYVDDKYTAINPPFSNVVFIDNITDNGFTISDINELSELVAPSLAYASMDAGRVYASVRDHCCVLSSCGCCDIYNKKAWASGVGSLEIIYNNEVMVKRYQLDAGVELVDCLLQNSDDEVRLIANSWKNSIEEGLLFGDECPLINFLASDQSRSRLVVKNYRDPYEEVNANIASNKLNENELTLKADKLVKRVGVQLDKLFQEHIVQPGGVSSAGNVLAEIMNELRRHLSLVYEVRHNCAERLVVEKELVECCSIDLQEYASLVFFIKTNKEKYADELSLRVNAYNDCLRTLKCCEVAIDVYKQVLEIVDGCRLKLDSLVCILKATQNGMRYAIDTLQHSVGNGDFSHLDVTKDDMALMRKITGVSAEAFLEYLDGKCRLIQFVNLSVNEIMQLMMDYAKQLPEVMECQNRGVEDVLCDLADRYPKRMSEYIWQIKYNSSPLFTYNYNGYLPSMLPCEYTFIGVGDSSSSLVKDNGVLDMVGYPAIERSKIYTSTGMKDRIIIYRSLGVVPLFTLPSIQRYREAFEECPDKELYFTNADVYNRMQESDFSIFPTNKE